MSTSTELSAARAAARPDLSDYLTRQILDLIRRDHLRPGDRLPTAKALAQRYAVATPTIREALRRLQATGVVDIRHGSGIYVRRDHQSLMVTNPALAGLSAETIPYLLEARLLIEPYLAECAATRITDAELAALDRLLDEARRLLEDRDEPLMRVNMAFHGAIARASGNPVLANVIESLIELYSSEQVAIATIYNARAEDHLDHRRILAALQERDAVLARERMRQHVQGVKAVVEERLRERSAADPPAAEDERA